MGGKRPDAFREHKIAYFDAGYHYLWYVEFQHGIQFNQGAHLSRGKLFPCLYAS